MVGTLEKGEEAQIGLSWQTPGAFQEVEKKVLPDYRDPHLQSPPWEAQERGLIYLSLRPGETGGGHGQGSLPPSGKGWIEIAAPIWQMNH